MKFLLLVIMFFLIGSFFIIYENNLALKDEEARKVFGKLYTSWFNQIFENSKNLVGYVVKLDWLPNNTST